MQKSINKMDCSFIRNNLFSYQEKMLSGTEYKEFEDHLHSCKACSLMVSEFQSATSFIDEKNAVEPNPYAAARILQRIESRMDGAKNKQSLFFQRILQPVSLSVLLLIAVVTGFSIVKQKAARYSESIIHQNDIQSMKSDLYISAFIDEDNALFDNYK